MGRVYIVDIKILHLYLSSPEEVLESACCNFILFARFITPIYRYHCAVLKSFIAITKTILEHYTLEGYMPASEGCTCLPACFKCFRSTSDEDYKLLS